MIQRCKFERVSSCNLASGKDNRLVKSLLLIVLLSLVVVVVVEEGRVDER